MTTARHALKSMVAVTCVAALMHVATAVSTTAATTPTAAKPEAAAEKAGTTAGTTATAKPSIALQNLKKLLTALDLNRMAESVTRLVYCATHHSKPIENAVTLHVAEWTACRSKNPTNMDATIVCFIRSSNNIPNFIALGQQIANMVNCLFLESPSPSEIICVKKVQKPDECGKVSCNGGPRSTALISSSAVPPTVRTDDCRLVTKGASTTSTNLTATLDITMKIMQCLPMYFSDTSQHVMDEIKVFTTCSQTHDDWYGWSKCILDGHDPKLLSLYLVKIRQAVACVAGGDVAQQSVCVFGVKSPDECKNCGGQDVVIVVPPEPLGPTANCA